MKNEANRLIETYFNAETLEKIKMMISCKDSLESMYNNTDLGLHRGFFLHALLLDINIGNVHRGKTVSKELKNKASNSIYYFNERKEVCLIEQYHKSNDSRSATLVCKMENKDFSITVPVTEGQDCITIGETCFKDNQVQRYVEIVFSLELQYDEIEDRETWWTINTLTDYFEQGGVASKLIEEKIEFFIEEYRYRANRLKEGILYFSRIIDDDKFRFNKTCFEFQYESDVLTDSVRVVDANKFYTLDDCQKAIIQCVNKSEDMFNWV